MELSKGNNKYFPNNWQRYKDADDEMFEPHTFDEVMDWKVCGWELPESVECIIRVQDVNTLKTTEHVYQRRSAAGKMVEKLMRTPNIQFTVVDHEQIHHLIPANLSDDYSDD